MTRKSKQLKSPRPKQPSTAKSTPAVQPRRWFHIGWKKGIIATGSTGLALFGAFTAWVSIRPSINIDVLPISGAGDEFSPRFVISNTGFLTAKRVSFSCVDGGRYQRDPDAIWVDTGWKPSKEDQEQFAREQDLKKGDKITYNCLLKPPPPGFTRTEGSWLNPIAIFREPLFFSDTAYTVRFVAHRDASGALYWQPDGEGITIYKDKRGDARGAITNTDVTDSYVHGTDLNMKNGAIIN